MLQLPLSIFEPVSNWAQPSHLPDLSHAKEIAIDTENRDPHLKTKGPGFIRNDGYVAGIGIAADTGFKGYFPIAHEQGGNLDADIVRRWLRETCSRNSVHYIFANAQYDLGWLRRMGVEVSGPVHDISIADCLIDEENPEGYSLEALGVRWLGSGKDEVLLREAAKAFDLDAKSDLWRLHSRFVGTYGETDALRTLQIWQRQKAALKSQGLWPIYELEQQLIRILFEMFWRGIRVDTDYAVQLNKRWLKRENEILKDLRVTVQDIWSPDFLATLCRKHGITVPKTDKGNDSVKKDFMTGLNHPAINPIIEARAIQRTRSIYLEQNLITNAFKGRIHPQYVQIASDEGGTRTGRLAAKNPNAQQFPKRSKLFDAKAIRKALLPEEGCQWAKLDYWSQEPVIQLHYGLVKKLPGTQEVLGQFRKGVKLYTFIEQATQGRCNYDEAKEVVLGRSYGMGKDKMASRMGIDQDKCSEVLGAFDAAVPYIKQLADAVGEVAQQRGFVHTLKGRRRRFNQWCPVRNWDGKYEHDWQDKRKFKAFSYEEAMDTYRVNGRPARIERAGTYKAFNGLIQGGAADQTKMGMIEVYKTITLPQIQVHDELGVSVESVQQAEQTKKIMEECIPLLAPVRVDLDLGASWQ